MNLLFGTTNPAKLSSMRAALKPLGIDVKGLNEIEGQLPYIAEDGNTPVENARQKSMGYYKAFGMPVFSCDSGLYFIDEPNLEQPGPFVRRYTGVEMTEDDQLINHYSSVAASNGGTIKAQYINGISLVLNEETVFDYQGDEISSSPFLITSKPHHKRVEGFPMNTISIDIKSGLYFYDIVTDSSDDSKWTKGTQAFFKRHLNL